MQQRNAEQEQRNAKLEAEVRELKSRNTPFAPVLPEPDRKATAGNASKAVFKGSKVEQKVYRRHTLYPDRYPIDRGDQS